MLLPNVFFKSAYVGQLRLQTPTGSTKQKPPTAADLAQGAGALPPHQALDRRGRPRLAVA